MIMGRKMMRATNEKSMPPMVPMAKANQNTSSLPSIRNGASPRTVEDGGEDGQRYGYDLVVVGPDETAVALGHPVVLVDDVDAGVDDDAGKHNHRGESALVKGRTRQPESQEDADEGHGYE